MCISGPPRPVHKLRSERHNLKSLSAASTARPVRRYYLPQPRTERQAPHAVEQIDKIVAVAVSAYAGDIAEQVLTGGNPALADLLWRGIVRAGALSGSIYVAAPAGDTDPHAIRAFAVWFPPGQLRYSTPEQRALGFTDLIDQFDPKFRTWFFDEFSAELRALKTRVFGPEMERGAMYANLIATDPAYQHRGLASALIRHVLAEAAQTGTIVALSTQGEKNAVFYRRLGFVEQGRLDKETPWGLFAGIVFIHESSLPMREKEIVA
ncbi:hypothetical protein BC834DRAFT_845098 [Gloeopeniophorella convolvens]|nr:hypothetical protein BC834DRAFT_845098 [Gloeopeniophorella convolvens]